MLFRSRFANKDTIQQMFLFPQDMREISSEINKLNNQRLVRLFEEEWSEYAH